MFVPKKPWPFGNKYHDAGCAESEIVWQVKLREGTDCLQHLGNREHDNRGKTVGTLLHCLTQPIHRAGRLVVLDSGFCILQGLVELEKVGVFTHALIKKRQYWPKHVPGEQIIQHFTDKSVSSSDAIKGESDGVPYHIYSMKEPDCHADYVNVWDNVRVG